MNYLLPYARLVTERDQLSQSELNQAGVSITKPNQFAGTTAQQ